MWGFLYYQFIIISSTRCSTSRSGYIIHVFNIGFFFKICRKHNGSILKWSWSINVRPRYNYIYPLHTLCYSRRQRNWPIFYSIRYSKHDVIINYTAAIWNRHSTIGLTAPKKKKKERHAIELFNQNNSIHFQLIHRLMAIFETIETLHYVCSTR